MKIRTVTSLVVLIFLIASANAQTKKWSLAECIDTAFRNNVSLNQQRLTNNVSAINYQQSKSNQLPSLNFTDGQSFSFGNTFNNGASSVTRQNTTTNTPVLASSITLYNGFRLKNLVKETRVNYDASILDLETQKNNLSLNIAAAYMQILYEYDAVTIAEHQIESDSEQLKRTEKYIAVGQSPLDSLYQIQAQMATDIALKVSVENQLQLSNVQLEQLMELPIRPEFEIQRPDMEVIPQNMITPSAEIYSLAERSFPEIKSAALKSTAAGVDLEVNKSALLPTLVLNGNINTEYYSGLSQYSYQTLYQNEEIGYLQSNPSQYVIGSVPSTTTYSRHYPFFNQFRDNFSQLISLNLTIPIFNGYKAQNSIRLSKIALESAKLNEQSAKNLLRKNVELAYTDRQGAFKNYQATQQQLVAEARSYKDMKIKLNVGLINLTNYLIEQNNYYKAVLANLQAKYELIFKAKVLDFYTGIPLTR